MSSREAERVNEGDDMAAWQDDEISCARAGIVPPVDRIKNFSLIMADNSDMAQIIHIHDVIF
jgi:hypothetical protein